MATVTNTHCYIFAHIR